MNKNVTIVFLPHEDHLVRKPWIPVHHAEQIPWTDWLWLLWLSVGKNVQSLLMISIGCGKIHTFMNSSMRLLSICQIQLRGNLDTWKSTMKKSEVLFAILMKYRLLLRVKHEENQILTDLPMFASVFKHIRYHLKA